MKIIRNYILKDFLSAFFFALLSLSMVLLLGNIMKISDMVVRKGVNILDAGKILLFFAPYVLGFTLPLAFLLGVLLTMGRLVADNEIVAINVAGVSANKLLNIFMLMAVIGSLSLFVLNDKIIPGFHYRYRSELKNIYSKNMTALIEPRVFMEHFNGFIVYVSDMAGDKLKNVYIYETKKDKSASKITFAKTAQFTVENNLLKMKLEDGFRDEAGSGKDTKQLYRLSFKTSFLEIPIERQEKTKIEKKPADMSIRELLDRGRELKLKGVDPTDIYAEFHQRISFSFSVIVFAFLAFVVSLIVRHREKSINFGIAFLIAGIYYLLSIGAEALVEYHKIGPMLGMWMPNIITAGTGIYLIKKNAHFK
jgi:lipopolysaccharide export system permease protein